MVLLGIRSAYNTRLMLSRTKILAVAPYRKSKTSSGAGAACIDRAPAGLMYASRRYRQRRRGHWPPLDVSCKTWQVYTKLAQSYIRQSAEMVAAGSQRTVLLHGS